MVFYRVLLSLVLFVSLFLGKQAFSLSVSIPLPSQFLGTLNSNGAFGVIDFADSVFKN